MQAIPRNSLIKCIRAAFEQELPDFRVFLYPMDRWVSAPGVETLGILVQITFLGEHITSHFRAPINEDGDMLLEDITDTVGRLVTSFRSSIRSLISAHQYREEQNLSFGEVLVAMRHGAKVARTGWNGKNMLLVMVPGFQITVEAGRPLASHFPGGAALAYASHIDMVTADKEVVPWTASQTDIQARDWRLV